MIRALGLLLLLLLAAIGCSTAEAAPLDPAAIPRSAAGAAGFAPPGWRVEKAVRADLSGDGLADLGIVLIERGTKDRLRALVVARGLRNGFERVGVSTTLLGCTGCGGAFWGVLPMPIHLSVEHGSLLVEQLGGSRETLETVHRLRIESSGRVRLIGIDSDSEDRATGNGKRVSTSYLTGRQRIQLILRGKLSRTRVRSVPTRTRYLESLRGRDRLGT